MVKKEKVELLENLPPCAAEFIRLVIKKMRYRKKVQADVMAELTAHFEDELRECTTDGQKEQKAQQLISDFGDAKLLAVLLRRAKKRCRPLWRTIVARTLQTAGIIIVCFIVYTTWFLTGKPVITVDYVAEVNRIVRPTADESLNAAPFYIKAAEQCEHWPEDISKLLGKKYNDVNDVQKQLIEKFLEDNRETLELVIAGTQKPYYWRTYEGEEMISVLVPYLAAFRQLAYSLRWRAWLSAEQGRYEDAFNDIKTCYRLGQHIRGDKPLIEQLVAIAIEAIAVQTLRDILDGHQFDSATLTALQEDFEQMIANEDFVVNLKPEKLTKYDEIQRCFTEDRFGGGHICLEGLRRCRMLTSGEDVSDMALLERFLAKPIRILFTHPNKQESREMVDRLYDYIEEISHKSPAQLRAENIDIEKEAMKIIKGNILLEILLPAYWRVHQISYRLPTGVNSTLAIIAILRYKRDTDEYPENLNQLVTMGYLKQLPMDLFSDKPLVYRKTNGDFLLYSVGLNFVDDGGELGRDGKGRVRPWADNGDTVFWPVGKN